ncbi:MAG: glycoside hydrolase family 5 protein [Bacteroidales bacterium]|nr:glycoside hydrolase family 5 protein [Bacteroidales bacterium]
MKKILEWAGAVALALLSLNACFPDDYLDETDPVIPEKPEQKPETEKPETEKPGEEIPEFTGPLELNVVGRYLKDAQGNIVNLHGFGQTYSPFFNNFAWNNYDVEGCLRHNQAMIDQVLAAGWRMNFIRMHMDPYWSDDTSKESVRYEGHERFSEERFRKYLDEVFVPMAEYATGKGLYVVMRPPGVSPEKIALEDDYQAFLIKVWDIVSSHKRLKNNGKVMFELANEPINILGTDGSYGSNGDGHFENMQLYFQAIIDKIRDNGADNIIWVPGLGYQSQYAGFATHRFAGDNIGFAVHVYPGWYNSDAEVGPNENVGGVSGGGYEGFQRGWDAQIMPVAEYAPVMVTEMDWAPAKYDSSWGKSITGVAGGEGFGANFKYIVDNTGNVSWMIFTSQELLAQFDGVPGTPGNYTFLNDPEACPWPVYHWFKEYAGEEVPEGELVSLEIAGVGESLEIRMGDSRSLVVKARYADGSVEAVTAKALMELSDEQVAVLENGKIVALKEGNTRLTVSYTSQSDVTRTLEVEVKVITPFPLTGAMFDPSIWEEGTFDESTRTLVTGQYGFGGWQYAEGLDLSGFKTITVELGNDNSSQVSFRLFDKNNYWSEPAMYDFQNSRKIVVDLHDMKDKNGNVISPDHLYIIGFWSLGGKPIIIDKITLE